LRKYLSIAAQPTGVPLGLFSTFANQALVVVNPNESGSSILISSFLREELALLLPKIHPSIACL
jgi:hypothetical protein